MTVLFLVMILLLSATRIYVGGPDGIEVVWKGELNFADTIVNLNEYIGIPKKDFAKHPSLLAQMEEMGFFDTDEPTRKFMRKPKKSLEPKPDDINKDSPDRRDEESGSDEQESGSQIKMKEDSSAEVK